MSGEVGRVIAVSVHHGGVLDEPPDVRVELADGAEIKLAGISHGKVAHELHQIGVERLWEPVSIVR